MYDLIIAGSGFCGSIIAYLAATELKKKVLIIEKRNHIAGNMYDEKDKHGIIVHKYGPHILHTNNEDIYNLLTQIGHWTRFNLKCRAVIDGISTPTPFNFCTIDSFYDAAKAKELKERLSIAYNSLPSAPIVDLLSSDDKMIKEYAEFLFEKDYRPYTSKQWGIPPERIDVSVLKRVPVYFSYNDKYFSDKYQIMPDGGYTYFFKKMLDNKLIDIELESNALERLQFDKKNRKILFNSNELNCPFIYTGAIDELFEYRFGRLPYRSLKFEYKSYDIASFQKAPVVAYPQEESYTRITEYSKLPVQEVGNHTTIAVEFPLDASTDEKLEPFYPIPTKETDELYHKYYKAAQEYSNLYLCGRLADYKYYNMDNAIERAIRVYKEIVKEIKV